MTSFFLARTTSICCLILCSLFCLFGCQQQSQQTLRLGVTTSTRDSGLLERILPEYEKQHNVRVQIIAAGTGAVLELARRGEVDAVIVHSKKDELDFFAQGYSNRRQPFMINSFVVLGPPADPARISGLDILKAFKQLQSQNVVFVSRGDSSGTHKREQMILENASIRPDWKNYLESGQGMGATLIIADQKMGYTLCDRGTYLKFKDKIELKPLVVKGNLLRNPYSVLTVKASTNKRQQLANQLVDYLISKPTQSEILRYKIDGESLFKPLNPAPEESTPKSNSSSRNKAP